MPNEIINSLIIIKGITLTLFCRKNRDRSKENLNIKVVFVIPLISSTVSKDWEKVLANLNNTLRSIIGQTDDRYEVIISSHDDLTGVIFESTKIRNIVVDFPAPKDFSGGDRDKHRKLRYAGAWMKKEEYDGDYVFFLDGDDLVSNNIVSDMLRENADAYVFTSGYVYDYAVSSVHTLNKRLFSICGSTFASKVQYSELPETTSPNNDIYYNLIAGSHAARASHACAWNKTVHPMHKRYVLYIINHVTSLENLKHGDRKQFRDRNGYDPMPILTTIFSQNQYLPNNAK